MQPVAAASLVFSPALERSHWLWREVQPAAVDVPTVLQMTVSCTGTHMHTKEPFLTPLVSTEVKKVISYRGYKKKSDLWHIYVTVNCQTVHTWWIPVYGTYSALRKQNNYFYKCPMKYKLSVHSYWATTPLTLQHWSEKNHFKICKPHSDFLLGNKVSERKAAFNPITWGLDAAACASRPLSLSERAAAPFSYWQGRLNPQLSRSYPASAPLSTPHDSPVSWCREGRGWNTILAFLQQQC